MNDVTAPVIERLTPQKCNAHGARIVELLQQLRGAETQISNDTLRCLSASDHVHIFIALADGTVAGTLTLVINRLLSAVRARIEDVVVDESFRRRGIAAALVQHAVAVAKKQAAKTIDLTSSPKRVAANALYQRLGFQTRETNVYRLDFILKRIGRAAEIFAE